MAGNLSDKCPSCGRPLPEGAPEGVCPVCAFRGSLSEISEASKFADSDSDTVPIRTSEADHDSVSRSLSSQRRTRKMLRTARWIVATALVAITSFYFVRILWTQTVHRPYIVLDDRLEIVFDPTQFGLEPGSRVISVNGRPVSTRDEMFDAIDASDEKIVDFVFDSRDTVRVRHVHTDQPFEYSVDATGRLTVHDRNETVRSAVGDLRVVSVNFTALDELGPDFPITEVPRFVDEHTQLQVYSQFGVSEAAGGGADFQVIVFPFSSVRQWSKFLAGLGFLTIGGLVFWVRPDSKASLSFFVFLVVIGVFSLLRGTPLWYRVPVENVIFLMLQCMIPAVAVLMVTTFTPLRLVGRKNYVVLSIAVMFSLILFASSSIQAPKMVAVGILSSDAFLWWARGLLSIVLISLPIDLWLRLSHVPITATDRQRIRTFRWAVFAGFVPATSYTAFIYLIDRNQVIAPLADATVLIFPAFLGYAIVRHNYLQLNELARQGLVYGLLMGLVSGIYVTGVSFLVPIIERFIPDSAEWSRSLLLAGSMLVALPMYNLTRRYVNTRMQRIDFDFEAFIVALEESEFEWHSPGEYCHALADHLSRMVNAPAVSVLIRPPGNSEWSITSTRRSAIDPDSTRRCRILCELIDQERSEIFLDDVIENIGYSRIRNELLGGFEALEASVVIPIISRGQLIGAISVGEKNSRTNYSTSELNTLRRIAVHSGSALYNLMSGAIVKAGNRIADIWPLSPEKIGGYTIKQSLGEGGMAYVFLGARDGKQYAVKVANRFVQSDRVLMERFHREASAVQRLEHPNIIKIAEVGWDGPEPYIAFDYFPGGSLDEALENGRILPGDRVAEIGVQVASALEEAQRQGIIHRDIKPRNIFVAEDGSVRVGDFGLARLADRSTLTEHGEVFGTPQYIAPEILRGEPSSPRSDQYALGVTLFELVTGQRPFEGENFEAITHQMMNFEPPDLRDDRFQVPAGLATTIRKMLSRDPHSRYASYAQLIAALESTVASK